MTQANIKTRTSIRVEHDNMHVEVGNKLDPTAKWRTCINHKTTEHVPPSFSTGMTRHDIRRLRDLCSVILEQVYEDFT